ncbi:MAG: single-stranded DNA-binding protein, partial [Bacillota bacterium]
CAQHLGKGRMVAVEGRLQIRKSKNENRTYINPEVVADNVQFLDWPGDNSGNRAENKSMSQRNSAPNRKTQNNYSNQNNKQNNFEEDEDFDVPF